MKLYDNVVDYKSMDELIMIRSDQYVKNYLPLNYLPIDQDHRCILFTMPSFRNDGVQFNRSSVRA